MLNDRPGLHNLWNTVPKDRAAKRIGEHIPTALPGCEDAPYRSRVDEVSDEPHLREVGGCRGDLMEGMGSWGLVSPN